MCLLLFSRTCTCKHWLAYIALCFKFIFCTAPKEKKRTEEHLFEWSHGKISSTNLKVRTTSSIQCTWLRLWWLDQKMATEGLVLLIYNQTSTWTQELTDVELVKLIYKLQSSIIFIIKLLSGRKSCTWKIEFRTNHLTEVYLHNSLSDSPKLVG